jgi:uncharacterized cupin superfamily protein
MSVIAQKVVNVDELTLEPFSQGEKFAGAGARVGSLLGAKDLGYSYNVVQPGKSSCPFHSHRAEEEMFFVVRGTGLLRYGNEKRQIREGDFICCPVGGPETAHQIINDSNAELAYVSVSTVMLADVCEYPDSGKIGAYGGSGAGRLNHMTEIASRVDYWKGE